MKKVHLSGAVVLSDMKIHLNSAPMKFQRPSLFSDFGQTSYLSSVNIFKGLFL